MKLFVLFFGFMVSIAGCASGSVWKMLGETDNRVMYVNTATISKVGKYVTITSLSNKLNTPSFGSRTLSTTSRVEYDCDLAVSRRLVFTGYSDLNASGNIIFVDEKPDQEMNLRALPRDTLAYSLADFACSYRN